MTFVLLYRDCTSSKPQFVDSLEQLLQSESMNDIILMGDVNINLLNDGESAEYHNT